MPRAVRIRSSKEEQQLFQRERDERGAGGETLNLDTLIRLQQGFKAC